MQQHYLVKLVQKPLTLTFKWINKQMLLLSALSHSPAPTSDPEQFQRQGLLLGGCCVLSLWWCPGGLLEVQQPQTCPRSEDPAPGFSLWLLKSRSLAPKAQSRILVSHETILGLALRLDCITAAPPFKLWEFGSAHLPEKRIKGIVSLDKSF